MIQTGRSGYGLYKLISHARRLIISSHPKILRTGALLGLFSMLIAGLLAMNTLYNAWLDPHALEVRGWTSLFISILFFGGISTLLLGVVLEYLTNVVLHSQGKPVFFQVDRQSDSILQTYFCNKD